MQKNKGAVVLNCKRSSRVFFQEDTLKKKVGDESDQWNMHAVVNKEKKPSLSNNLILDLKK